MKPRRLSNTTVLAGLVGLAILTAATLVFAVQPAFLSIASSGSDIKITIHGTLNTYYVLQATSDLSNTNWTAISTNITDLGGTVSPTDKNALTLYPQRFYRAYPLN